ncbi:MAG: ThiF family adenylyltransferase [Verrucomicrobiota bacterium]
MMKPAEVLHLAETRFARLEMIDWWDQKRLARARVLVIGAGAIGNEVMKNLALLGIGRVVVADMDHVELSNLSRSVLFRESDEGAAKAECAVRAARQIYPDLDARAVVGNVLAGLGLGYFRWADAVIGALDNREARVFVNSACARVGRAWFDGGIEVLHGVVRGFAPPRTACYECTMSEVDWALLNKRRSCSLLARRAIANNGTPTTPTTASVIGAMQVQEMVKYLHGRRTLLGSGFIFDGAEHSSYRVEYSINPGCPWHDQPAPIESFPQFTSDTSLEALWQEAARKLGGVDAIDLAREIIERAECATCGQQREVLTTAESVQEDQLLCPRCRTECAPVFLHSLVEGSPLLKKTARQIGLPAWDIVWARYGTQSLGLEFSGDNPFRAGNGPDEMLTERQT